MTCKDRVLIEIAHIFFRLSYHFSKMTYAQLSQATAASQRFFHRTQTTFNKIQNTFVSNEIHDQGKKNNGK